MKKLLFIFGTRPEAIKMAPLIKEFQKHPDHFTVKICVTGQHRKMLDQVLDIFEILPDYDLDIMEPNQGLSKITTKILLGLESILQELRPDIVFVHGDTTTSMASSLAAFYQQINVAHIEAGLRTHNIYSPWPEEINRQLIDRISKYYFAPTELSRKNLLQENISSEQIHVTGNTVIDALFWVIDKISNNSYLETSLKEQINREGYSLEKSNNRKLILVTGHRRENFGEGFLNICKALKEIALSQPQVDIVYPVHLNPNIQKPVYDLLSDIENIYLIPPLDYLPFILLMQKSYIILTDSGGIQEEAPALGKPVLVMRETTERPEAVEAGTVKLVGANTSQIISYANLLLEDTALYQKMSQAHNPYGDGKACERIVNFFLDNQPI